jgi:hypothetical protein
MIDELFFKHPRSVGESYLEHAAMALSFAARLFAAAIACLIHAVVPGVCQRTGSRIIAELYGRMVSGRRRTAVAEIDYAI